MKRIAERRFSMFMPAGLVADDPKLVREAERRVREYADQEGLIVESGPMYATRTTKAKVHDQDGRLIYNGAPDGIELYSFTWTAGPAGDVS